MRCNCLKMLEKMLGTPQLFYLRVDKLVDSLSGTRKESLLRTKFLQKGLDSSSAGEATAAHLL